MCICNKSQKHRVQTCWSLYEYMFLSHRRNHQLLYDIVNRQRLIIQTAVLTAFQEGKYSLHLFIKQIFNLRSLPILNKDGGSAATCRENRASEPQRSVCKNNVCVRTTSVWERVWVQQEVFMCFPRNLSVFNPVKFTAIKHLCHINRSFQMSVFKTNRRLMFYS